MIKIKTTSGVTPTPQLGVMSRAFSKIQQIYKSFALNKNSPIISRRHTSTTPSLVFGFTLIETLVWVAVFTLAMGAIVLSLLSFYRSNTYTIDQAQAVSDARRGIERSVQMMREISFASDGAYPVVSISANQFHFYSDIDSDPFLESVRLFVDGTALKQGITKASGDPPVYSGPEVVSVVAENVRNIDQSVTTFKYYDKDGIEITDGDLLDVRFVTVDIVMNVSPNQLPNQLTLRSSATLRNLRN